LGNVNNDNTSGVAHIMKSTLYSNLLNILPDLIKKDHVSKTNKNNINEIINQINIFSKTLGDNVEQNKSAVDNAPKFPFQMLFLHDVEIVDAFQENILKHLNTMLMSCSTE